MKTADYLKAVGFSVSIDREVFHPGKSLGEQIKKAINQCDCFLPLLSEDSIQSKYVKREIAYADFCDKPMIPILCGRVEYSGLPLEVFGLLFLDLREHTFKEAMKELVVSIYKVIDPDFDPTPTPLIDSASKLAKDAQETSNDAVNIAYLNGGGSDKDYLDTLLPQRITTTTLGITLLRRTLLRPNSATMRWVIMPLVPSPFESFDYDPVGNLTWTTNANSHTTVPEDDWTVKVIGEPTAADGLTWWDTTGVLVLVDSGIYDDHPDLSGLLDKMETIVDQAFQSSQSSEYEARLRIN